jgi:hypothetical protein
VRAALHSGWGRLNLTLFCVALFCATFWFTDRITNQQPPAPRIDPAAVTAHRATLPPRPRVFVLILDSLAYGVATNAEVMPHLAALRAEGVSARVDSGFNSSSAAALRDAFTGRENAAVLAVVSTFLKTDAGVESIFHQLALAGRTSAAHSTGFFGQFGAGVARAVTIPYRSPREVDEASVLAAAESLRRDEFDFVVGHLSYTDYAAHDFGIHQAGYREAFHRADALIPRVRALLPPGATLVVMGDHGHDAQGKHGFGMEVPTFAVYVGPAFRRGLALPPINLPSHRFLMSYAAGIPLATDGYSGRFLPEALDGRHDQVQWLIAQAQAARHRAQQRGWLLWIHLSLLGAFAFNLVCRGHSPLDFTGGRAAALWLGVAPLLLTGPWQPLVGLLVMLGLVGLLGRGVPVKSLALWIALPAAVALGFQAWGRVLVAARPTLQHLSGPGFAAVWLLLGLAAVACATRARRATVMGVVVGAAVLLLPPTGERHGFPATIAPLLLCWLACLAVALWRDGALADRAAARPLAGGALAVFALLQPFGASEVVAGIFIRWHALVPGLTLDNVPYFLLLALLAKAVLFFPDWPGAIGAAVRAAFVAGLLLIESRAWVPNAYVHLAMMATSAAGWLVLGRWRQRPADAWPCALTFWFLLYYYCIALTPRNFLEIGCLVGALALCARLARRWVPPETLHADYLVFAVVGLLIAGWACMRWTTSELEWHTTYQWFAARTVEHYVAFFIPWIALKCLVPWVLILLCLRRELAPAAPLPANALLIVFAVKLLSMLMINTGQGGIDTLNRSYLEAACVSGVLAVLLLGVIPLRNAWPRPASPADAR